MACTANSTSVNVASATFAHSEVNRRIFLPLFLSTPARRSLPKIANGGRERITQIAYFSRIGRNLSNFGVRRRISAQEHHLSYFLRPGSGTGGPSVWRWSLRPPPRRP